MSASRLPRIEICLLVLLLFNLYYALHERHRRRRHHPRYHCRPDRHRRRRRRRFCSILSFRTFYLISLELCATFFSRWRC